MNRFAMASVVIIFSGACCAQVSGATYRCVDDAGRSTYTNVKEEMGGRKCVVVSREVEVVPAPAVWDKPNSTEKQFVMEKGQCEAQGLSVTGLPAQQVMAVFNACMVGKGWKLLDTPTQHP